MKLKIIENDKNKAVRSKYYNYNFDKENGNFSRWGQTFEDDPSFAPGPELLDIEISAGKCSGNCKFCYKENNSSKKAENMTFAQFKNILDKMSPTLTQIAFGLCDIDSNPDFFKMMEYSKSKGVIPNFTCNGYGTTPEFAKKVASICGACAVSIYNKEASYNTIKMFTDAGMDQVNIHFMLSEETYEDAVGVVCDIQNDPRLKDMNAVVFLAYKPKGANRGVFTTVKNVNQYRFLTNLCDAKGIAYGMDSCSAGMYISSIQDKEDRVELSKFVESCESSMFSGYINCKGVYYHCSFAEGEGEWKDGIDVLGCKDFIHDVWNHELTKKFRRASVMSAKKNPYKDCGDCRSCLIFPEINPW